jgi:tetratricopeptide (TPR) repeat protein
MSVLSEDLRQLIEHDQKSARPLLHDLVERLPKSAEARALLAQSYLRSLEAAPALEHYRIAHALDPKNLAIRHQMGLCSVALGDYASALDIYVEAAKTAPTEHSEAMAALMLHRLGRVADSVRIYSTLLGKLKRDHVEAPHVLRGAAWLLRDAGAPLAADRFLQELIGVYRLAPERVASLLVERDNSIDYPGWTRFANKSELGHALNRAGGKPGAPRFPASFVLPGDRAALMDYAAGHPGALFIAKPERGTGGQGMTIGADVSVMADREGVVVQQYVERPYLVDGRKGHIRLYGLVTSLAPFRAYLYGDGIVRFAPDTYDLSAESLANVHAHVTNTALHHGHPKLEVSEDATKENVGAVWSLTAYLDRMKAEGVDTDAVRAELRALVRGFIGVLAEEGLFTGQAKAAPRRAFPYKLFGLDVLIDADGKPWLIEAQRKPALGGSALVRKINGRMFQTIFEMSCGFAFDDSMPAETIAKIAKDRAVLAQREADHEVARKGLFESVA